MRKTMSIVLAVLMVLTTLVPLNAQTEGRSGKVELKSENEIVDSTTTDALEKLDSQMSELFKNGELNENDRFNFIVEIEGDTNKEKAPIGIVSERGTRMFKTQSVSRRDDAKLRNFVSRRIEEQNQVLNNIFNGNQEALGGMRTFSMTRSSNDFSNIRRFKALVNGFVLEGLTYNQAREIAKTNGVKSITAEVVLNRPKNNVEATPQMHYSREIVKAAQSVQRGYDGSGRIIAILDSGADVTHKDLVIKNHDAVKLDKEMVDSLIQKNAMRGKYFNEKFPYGYNYYDRNFNLKDGNPKLGMHGQHIAGTIAGNGDPEDPLAVIGIVPEAQILALRVFGEYEPLTGTSQYTEALDDAVLLGADGANMSLGSVSGPVANDPVFEEAIQKAKEAGVLVAIANGNDGYSLSKTEKLPRAENVEWSTAGSPATMKDSLAVASFNNTELISENSIEYNGETIKTAAMSSISTADFSKFEYNKEYEFVFVGVSKDKSEYDGLDLNGKIAVVQRGVNSFTEKITMAREAGAIAVIVVDDGRAGEGLFTMSTDDNLIPSYFISLSVLDKIKDANPNKITITDTPSNFESKVKGQMSSFSSWGPAPSLEMKPEITAPGGDIRSTLNDNKYGYMSGTSMATPHVAGGIAVAMKKLEELNLGAIDNRFEYAKSILMLTADPIKMPGSSSLYYSPRWQGAGMMNLDKLTANNFVFVTDNGNNVSNGKSKIEFQNISSNSVEINLNLRNFADKAVKYEVYTQIQTDKIVDGKNTMTPDVLLANTKIGEVEVSANGSANFTKKVDFESNGYETLAPNGYFVDGFVFLKPVEGQKGFEEISVPFIGFRGDYTKAPVIEKFIDEFDLATEKTLWQEYQNLIIDNNLNEKDANFTHFIIERKDIANGAGFEDTLGRTADKSEFTNNFAISPNADGYQDFVKFKGVFLRNYTNFGLRVFDARNNQVKFIQNTWRKEGKKAVNTVNGQKSFALTENVWNWDGKDSNGNVVPDGRYYIDVEVAPGEFKDAKQIIRKEILVDTVNPTIENATVDMVGNKLTIKAEGVEDDASGIYGVYMVQDDDWWFGLAPSQDGEWKWEGDADSNFKLDKSKVVFKVVDWAGNITVKDINLETGNGKLNLTKVNKLNANDIPTNIVEVYKVMDGGEISKTPADMNNLSNGRYVIGFKDIPSSYKYEFSPSNEFEITDANKTANVEIKFEKIDTNDFANLSVEVIWPGDYPGEIKVFAIDKSGKKYQLYRRLEWAYKEYFAQLPAGEYTIVAEGSNKFRKLDMENNNAVVNLEPGQREYIKMQAVLAMLQIPVFVESANQNSNVFDIFRDNEFEPLDKGFRLKNPEKFFEITHNQTGISIFDSTANGWDDGTRPGFVYAEKGKFWINFWIAAPTGDYTVKLINYDTNKYTAHNNPITSKPYSNEALEKKEAEWKGIFIEDKSSDKGSVKIVEGFIGSDENKAKLNAKYVLADELGKEIEVKGLEIANVTPGEYTLYPRTDAQEFKSENPSYKVFVEPGKETKVEVRWEDLSTNKRNRSNVVVAMVGEMPPVDSLKVRFTNKDGKVVEDTLYLKEGEGKSTTLLDIGVYDFEVIGLPEDYSLELQWIGNDNIKNQNKRNTKMTVVVDQSWYSIEYAIRKQAIEEKEASLNIIEKGNDGHIGEYRIIGEGIDITQRRLKFLNLKPGNYVLKVVSPKGYDPVADIHLTLHEGDNEITVAYNKTEEKVDKPSNGGSFFEPSPDYLNNNYKPKVDKKPEKKEEKVEEPKEVKPSQEVKKDYGVSLPAKVEPMVFNDVSADQKEVVDFVTSYQIMKGTDNGKFEPNTPISRAMVVKTLMRIAKDKSISESFKFNDVKINEWYTDSVYWAATHGYVLGDDKGNFNPNGLLTRQEFALILERFLRMNGISLEKLKSLNVNDINSIPSWSIDAVKAMAENGLVQPESESMYNPTSNVTRYELARAFKILIEWIMNN